MDAFSGHLSVESSHSNHSSEGTTQNLIFRNLLFLCMFLGHTHVEDAKIMLPYGPKFWRG